MLAQIAHAREIRQRLRNPPNAVRDLGINLKRKIITITECAKAEIVPINRNEAAVSQAMQRDAAVIEAATAPSEPAKPIDNRPRVEAIQKVVAKHFGVTMAVMRSPCRTAKFVLIRQIAMYLACVVWRRSLNETGRMFSRDHTTVMHGHRVIAARIDRDPEFAALIEQLKSEILAA